MAVSPGSPWHARSELQAPPRMAGYAFADVTGDKGTVTVFICNHCPYVKAVIDRLVANPRVVMAEGIGFAAICSNDATDYSED